MGTAKGARWSAAETDQLRRLAKEGITRSEAARRMGRSPATIRRVCIDAGIQWGPAAAATPRRPRTPPAGGQLTWRQIGASSSWRRARVAPLDGIRGLALAAVLAYHVAPASVRGGFLGVDVFFVLSGFLLTSLLLEEHGHDGTVDRRAYAVRRLRRIVPALAVVLIVLAVMVPILSPDDTQRLRPDVVWSMLGLTNWHLILDGTSYFNHLGRPPFVRHLWSIAVEVQFYIVCPFLVAWLARRRRSLAVAVLTAGILASATAMALLYTSPDPSRAYFGTDTRIGALLVGVLVAVITVESRVTGGLPSWPRRLRAPLAVIPILVLAALVAAADERSRLLYPAGFMLTQVATALVILTALRPGRLAEVLAWGPLRWLGQRSYGIYLWSWPVVMLTHPGPDAPWWPLVAVPSAVVASLVLGELSYRLVELPWMRPAPSSLWSLSPTRRRQLRLGAIGLTVLVLAGALSRAPEPDPIADSLVAGQQVIEAQQSRVELAPSPAATSSGPAGAPTQVVLSPPPPPGTLPVTAIGDSVMLGAAPALQARFGTTGYIDAKVNRQFSAGVDVARNLEAQGKLGTVMVIDLGNNGPFKPSDMDSMMRLVPPGTRVLLVTVRVDAAWQDAVNQALRDSASRYSSIKLVDWFGYSENHPEYFWNDGTHLRPAGANAFADLIAGSLR
jgi:peptidoglycan/LPS O-acetylase OafA/YrhL